MKTKRTPIEKIVIGLNAFALVSSIKNGDILGIVFYSCTTGLAIIETDDKLAYKFNSDPVKFFKDLI